MHTSLALVIDDELGVREVVGHHLRNIGAKVLLASEGKEGLDLLRREPVDVMFTDLCLPGMDGITILREAVKCRPQLAAVILTGYASLETSVEALRYGACDYVTKPVSLEKVRSAWARAMRMRNSFQTSRVAVTPPSQSDANRSSREIVAQSPAMNNVLKVVARVAPTNSPVLIQGETGVGKGLIARSIHDRSLRAQQSFIHANCAALSPDHLLEELCGIEPALSLTQVDHRSGMFERANGGTLFLDNLEELPLSVQARLLDSLQEGQFYRVGGGGAVAMDVRIVSATKMNLQTEVAQGTFHRGLLDHLSVVCIDIPSLRYRQEDLRALVRHFLARLQHDLKPTAAQALRLSQEAWDRLLHYDWPGNVRELATVVEHAVLLAEGDEIGLESLPESLRKRRPPETVEKLSLPLVGDIRTIERSVIQEVIDRCHGNKAAAARLLGMHRRTLYRKIARCQA